MEKERAYYDIFDHGFIERRMIEGRSEEEAEIDLKKFNELHRVIKGGYLYEMRHGFLEGLEPYETEKEATKFLMEAMEILTDLVGEDPNLNYSEEVWKDFLIYAEEEYKI